MSKNYTSVLEVSIDYGLYTSVKQSVNLTLGYVPSLARNRWPFIVTNWNTFFDQFNVFANGDEKLINNLKDLDNAVQSYNLGNTSNYLENTTNYQKSFQFLNLISVSSLRLSPEEQSLRDQEIDRVNRFEVEDLQQMYNFLRKYIALFAGSLGLSDPTADKLLGISTQKKQRPATIADVTTMSNLEDFKSAVASTIYDLQRTTKRPPDLIASGNSNIDPDSPVQFEDDYLSYFTVPFEISLESMAHKHLGTVDKLFELVSVNNLKPPYVDEVGTKLNLLAPAALNNLIISSELKTNVSVGTKVRIGSASQKEEARIVERIIFNENDTMILFLSGSQDLNRFLPTENAYVRIFTPHTTRSGEFIFIPVALRSGNGQAKKTPHADYLRRLSKTLRNFGVDLYRDPTTGDFVFDPNGNFKLSSGYDNVRKTVLNALKRTQGELSWHPSYGVNETIGGQFFGSKDEAVLFGELLRNTILKDSRFESVLISALSTTSRSISLKLLVKIAGSNEFIPLAFVG